MIPIGITQRCWQAPDYPEVRDALDVRWPQFLARCGIVAVPLPNDATLAVQHATLLGVTGIILSGGDDLARYGGHAPHRDATEKALLAWTIENGRPLLGVCRGMHVLLDAFGAVLDQVDGHVGHMHEVLFDNGERRTVNSYHRWAVRSVPDPLAPTAWAADVVEACCHPGLPMRGIMWHPERFSTPTEEDMTMVRNLFGRQE